MRKFRFDPYSALNQRIIDASIFSIAFYFAYGLFEGHGVDSSSAVKWAFLATMILGQVVANISLHTYQMIWRYVSLRDAITLARNYAVFPAVALIMEFFLRRLDPALNLPAGVVFAGYFFSLFGALAARAARRLLYERITERALDGASTTSVLLIGAGKIGVKTANEIRSHVDLQPVGFLDDNPQKWGSVIGGFRVLGPLASLAPTIQKFGVRQVIVCIAHPSREILRRIWATGELLGVPVKIVPTLEEILHGKVNIANFREVEMKDLLGRNSVEGSASEAELSEAYRGKSILVTGAGGSIGSELALQLWKLQPSHLLLLDKDENGLNDVYLQLQSQGLTTATPVVADLRFPERLRTIFENHRPQVVFHAAAHKHLHLMELNPCEAVANNITGTRNLVEQAVRFGVARFVQISTDKAVNPTSIMGATKRICEMIVQAQADRHRTLFCCVRFGNVLGSRGSVVPIFQQQILKGGPVTVTHARAERFLMTIPEAVCLLIHAGTLAHSKEIFVLDMGEPVLIQNLAHDLIELSGLSPTGDIRIEITGMKRGEKLSEVLIDDRSETLRPTRLHKIQTIATRPFDIAEFTARLRALEASAWQGRAEDVYLHLADVNIGFVSHGSPPSVPVHVAQVVEGPSAAMGAAFGA
ncbi:MAG TPA: nucleoside-diphosphate sugar epimerase/dehydratase [Candidatus Dormibacteraeota bacterium]|nr:nucleoside-diphosphate sugar epimerase/dehydratase [Candidatus Dormibacteraeota bacterium]